MGRLVPTTTRNEPISSSLTGKGVLPTPTMCTTPGTVSTGNRLFTSNRQNRYPGKRGLTRAEPEAPSRTYSGRNTSYPLPERPSDVFFSRLLFTLTANQVTVLSALKDTTTSHVKTTLENTHLEEKTF